MVIKRRVASGMGEVVPARTSPTSPMSAVIILFQSVSASVVATGTVRVKRRGQGGMS